MNRELCIAIVASQLHEDWRTSWRLENGKLNGCAPAKLEKTYDKEWVLRRRDEGAVINVASGGRFSLEIDIFAVSYDALPPDLQKEYRADAEACVDAYLKSRAYKIGNLEPAMEWAAARVHDAWLNRHASNADMNLVCDFTALPHAEQNKRRHVALRTIQTIKMFWARR